MRTVLLGSDFIYNKDGELKIIETNTAVGWNRNKYESDDQSLDLSSLSSFITQKGFTKVIYIGGIEILSEKLNHLCTGFTIEYQFIRVDRTSITVPFVEDNEQTLIIRSSYDTTALIDDKYCNDNLEFLILIQNESFGSKIAYIDENNNLVSTITSIVDNGDNPNYVLKSRYANYDKRLYPKFYKVSNLDELNLVLQNVTSQYYLMEYHYNGLNIFEDHLKVYRSLNILFPPNLESISIGGYTTFCDAQLSIVNNYDDTTHELIEHRYKYLSFDTGFVKPKLLDSDLVQLSDGTWKSALNLQEGDILRTIHIPNPFDYKNFNESINYKIDYNTFLSGVTYDANTLVSKERRNIWSKTTKIFFTDDTTWEDSMGSVYLSYRNNEVRFLSLDSNLAEDKRIKIGDEIILIDTSSTNPEFVKKTIQNITESFQFFGGWVISVADERIFLTKSAENNSQFASIEHNVGCSAMGCYSTFPCPKTAAQCCGPWNICITSCAFCPQV